LPDLHNLKPEVFMESTSWRWNTKNSATVGMAATVAAAMT